MANVKISQLPIASSVGASDSLPLVQGSVTKQATKQVLLNDLGTPSAAVLTNATGLPLTTGVTGVLPVANGGTGQTSLTANNVLLGNGTSGVQVVAPGSSGNVLTSNGSTWTSAAPASAPVTSVNGLTGAVSMTGLGDIGSYAVLMIATNTDVAVNSTVAGSNLRYGWTPNVGPVGINGGTTWSSFGANRSNVSAVYSGGGTSLSGTWRKVSTGATYFGISGCCLQAYYWCAALYVRIS